MGRAKKERTEQLKRATIDYLRREQAQNAIEQHNFDKLVKSGVIKPNAK